MKWILSWVCAVMLVTVAMPRLLQAEDQEMVIKSQKGIRFKVPADWPLEERNGAIGPIPTEEYMSRKFSALNARLDTIDRQMVAMETRIKALEQQSVSRSNALQSSLIERQGSSE